MNYIGRAVINKKHENLNPPIRTGQYLKNVWRRRVLFSLCWFLSFFLFCGFLSAQTQGTRESDLVSVEEALKYADARMWDRAYESVKDLNSPLLKELLDWLRLRAGDGRVKEYIEFMTLNENWPGMPLLAKTGEKKIKYGEDPDTILDYFKYSFPKTGHGSLVLANALMQLEQTQDAKKVAKISWLDQEFSDDDFLLMLKNFDDVLSQTHQIRLENLLWSKARNSVLQMARVMSEEELLLARKRLKLQKSVKVSSKSIKVSQEYWQNPGVLFDLSNNLQRQKNYTEVSNILKKVSKSFDLLGRPRNWKRLRVYHTRRALRLGKIKTAYELASNHFIEPNQLTNVNYNKVYEDYVDLEFLAGFISLNFQKKPEIASRHFERAIKLAKKKVNVSKLNYWYGRSLKKLNRPNQARTAFELASNHSSTFYGQLSAERIGKKDVSLDPLTKPGLICDKEKMLQNEIVKVGVLLLKANRIVLGVRFLKHAAETLDPDGRICILKFLHDSKHWSGVIGIAKKFISEDDIIFNYSYPVLNLTQENLGAPLPLVYAIIRQESEFYSGARSVAGALGLMQVMPNTAKYLAKRLGLKYDKKRMLRDELYNTKLGTQYVKELLRSFRGSTVLSIAAYNAGPGSVRSWIKRYGDPRRKGVDPLIWIEMIPYTETRNYVMRVLGNELIYRALIEKTSLKFDRAKKNFGHEF